MLLYYVAPCNPPIVILNTMIENVKKWQKHFSIPKGLGSKVSKIQLPLPLIFSLMISYGSQYLFMLISNLILI